MNKEDEILKNILIHIDNIEREIKIMRFNRERYLFSKNHFTKVHAQKIIYYSGSISKLLKEI